MNQVDKHLQTSHRWAHKGTTLAAIHNIQEATQFIMQGFTVIDLYKVLNLYNELLNRHYLSPEFNYQVRVLLIESCREC